MRSVANSHQSRVIHGNPAGVAALLLLGSALGTALFAPWLFALAERASPLRLTLDAGPLSIVGACLVALAIHEAGFAAAAALAGLRVEGYRFAGTGGFTLAAPALRPDSARGKLFLALAGGPCACFAGGFGFLALFLAAVLEGPPSGAGFSGLVSTALLSMFGVSLFPVSLFGLRNAGSVMRSLVSGDRTGRQIATTFAALASAPAGRRPEHWPAEIEEVIALPQGDAAGFLMGRYLGHLRCLDRGDIEGAHRQLALMVRRFRGIDRAFLAEFACEVAYFQARHCGRPGSSWKWLAEADGAKRVSAAALARARAAAHLAEGNREQGVAEIMRLVQAIQASPLDGVTLLEMSLLDDLRAHYGLDARRALTSGEQAPDVAPAIPARLRLVSIARR